MADSLARIAERDQPHIVLLFIPSQPSWPFHNVQLYCPFHNHIMILFPNNLNFKWWANQM